MVRHWYPTLNWRSTLACKSSHLHEETPTPTCLGKPGSELCRRLQCVITRASAASSAQDCAPCSSDQGRRLRTLVLPEGEGGLARQRARQGPRRRQRQRVRGAAGACAARWFSARLRRNVLSFAAVCPTLLYGMIEAYKFSNAKQARASESNLEFYSQRSRLSRSTTSPIAAHARSPSLAQSAAA
eukprot:scaffold30172_cov101-Isochrysis_galbana.AAC.1